MSTPLALSPAGGTFNLVAGVAQTALVVNVPGHSTGDGTISSMVVLGIPSIDGITTDGHGFSCEGNNEDHLEIHLSALSTPGVFTHTVRVTARNPDGSQGGHVDAIYTFNVSADTYTFSVNDAEISATVGQEFSYQPTTSPGASVASWDISPLPPGLTYDTTTGLISGTPTTAGIYNTTMHAQSTGPSVVPATVLGAGVLTTTVQAVGDTTDSQVVIEINLGTGAITVVSGAPLSYFGDEKIIEANFVPAANAGNVSNVSFTFKEKSQVPQYQTLLSGTAPAGDGTHFVFPVTTFAGDALRDSILLYDDVEPSTSVTYSLEVFFKWSGRIRKSWILDWTVNRPQDMDFAVAGEVIPGSPSAPAPSGLIRYSPNGTAFSILVDDNGILNAVPV